MNVPSLRFLTILLIGLTIFGTTHAEDAWPEYRSIEGGFAVSFPGAPKLTNQTAPDGESIHSVVVDLDKTAFLVLYTDYGTGTFAGGDPALALDQVRDRLVGDQKTQLRIERNFTFKSRPARELVIDDAHGSTQIYRLYIVGDRLYQVICGGPKGFETSPDAQRFENSFRLTAQ